MAERSVDVRRTLFSDTVGPLMEVGIAQTLLEIV